MSKSLTLTVIALTLMAVVSSAKIDHFIVLMLENRSFDHMCGRLNRKDKRINGLTGNEFNITTGPTSYVRDKCPYVNPFDPNHGFPSVTRQIMGQEKSWIDPAPMSGFVRDHFLSHRKDFWEVMNGFAPERVPTISTLAAEFAIFD